MRRKMTHGISGLVRHAGRPLAVCLLLLAAVSPGPLLAQKAPPPAGPAGRPLKLVLARQSTADPVELMKHLSQKCPNITITTNQQNSDYMLYAGGWSGAGYRFMVIAKGGDTIYATETALLSNAVKDVCKFLNSRP
jgi:hypothetical protein